MPGAFRDVDHSMPIRWSRRRSSTSIGAVASGGYVIGLVAGTHCAPGHDERLHAIGVDAIAHDFDAVSALLA